MRSYRSSTCKVALIIVSAFFISTALLTGCASAGHEINKDAVSRIIIGKTTKDDMIRTFGNPLSQSYGPEGKLMMNWFYAHIRPFGVGMQNQNLAVLFDKNEKVEKYNMLDGGGENGVGFGL